MSFRCGIVGLPNVGKSTLFNALTQTAAAEAANYPFCTIEPNIGKVAVPDPRLFELAKIAGSKETIPAQLEFVDIAGLVKGASAGEGLGNQFLSHIREVDVVVQVLRCFEDSDITHVEGSVDPIRDAEIIETELILADLESLEKRVVGLEKRLRSNDKDAKEQKPIIEGLIKHLGAGNPARSFEIADDQVRAFKMLQLLTSKPILYVCNVAENEVPDGNALSEKVVKYAEASGASCLNVSAKIESEIATLESEEEKQLFLEELGLVETGLSQIIRAGYILLDRITFFTIGPKEARAWSVKKGAKAPQAAGVIHTDFERGFIAAEMIGFNDYIEFKGENGAKEAGKMQLQGRDYVANDGDVFHFRFNV